MGGEWAGATVVTAELAPVHRRGYYGMYPQLGPALGFLLSSATFLLTTLTMSDAAFLSWGWRVPFLAERIAPAKRVSDFAQHGQHELLDAPFGSKVQRVEVRRGTRLPELRQLHLPQYFSGHRPGGSGAGRRRGRQV
ncbi:hypothetical protein EJI01_25880 [Variovorax sp. MHTC-1]|nr:hypothetical protein EJI01_25880 [Variovorax sp. MHTC-1]